MISTPAALVLASAGILASLGTAHLVLTFRGPKLLPRDRELRARMEATHPVITKETTFWRAWIGFNATHSLGAMVFGAVYGYLAIAHADLLLQSWPLLAIGLVTLLAYLVLAKLYFFRTPLAGISVALMCFVVAVILRS